MSLSLKSVLTDNALLKVFSLIIGYGFWCAISQSHTATIEVDVPLCVYATPEQCLINAPEKIHVTLAGRRSELSTLDLDQLALHIDGRKLTPGENPQLFIDATLFLPGTVKLLHYTPMNVSIKVTPKNLVPLNNIPQHESII